MLSLDELPSEVDLERELVARGGFTEFVKVAWPQVDPSPYVHSRHIDVVCAHLVAVYDRRIRNLLINIPPGTSKSTLTCVLFNAWVWIQDPAKRFLYTANDPDIALRDARKTKNLISSEWFQERWPHVRIADDGRDAQGEFETTAKGSRVSVGIGQKVVGRHADFKIADDANKPLDSMGKSEVTSAQIDQVNNAWDSTFGTRNTDIKTTATINVQQRVSTKDLTGHLMEKWKRGGIQFDHLRLPMRYEASDPCRTAIGGDWRTEEGELLVPERMDAESVRLLEGELGSSRLVAAQLQQRPAPRGGNIIKATWLRHWGPCSVYCKERACPGPALLTLPPLRDMRIEQSWDMNFKGGQTSDYVVGQVWGKWSGWAILLDQVREQFTFTQTLEAFRKLTEKWPMAHKKTVERAGNAEAIKNVLQHKIPGIILVSPNGSKEDRLRACEPVYESGLVLYPSAVHAPWIEINIQELLMFPAAAHDDTVDSSTQFLQGVSRGSILELIKSANQGATAA